MAKTVHVYRSEKGWTVKREGAKASKVFPTKKQAVGVARALVKDSAPSQMVVHGVDGRIKIHETHGLPRVQDPPRKNLRLEKVVSRHALERVRSER